MKQDGHPPLQPAIIWFRQDLRLADHAALHAAMATGRAGPAGLRAGRRERRRMARSGGPRAGGCIGSLASLQAVVARRPAPPLVLRRGRAAAVLAALIEETGACEIHAGRMHEPWARAVEAEHRAAARPEASCICTGPATLFDLDSRSSTKTGGIYGVYTPFANTLRARGDQPARATLPRPKRIPAVAGPGQRHARRAGDCCRRTPRLGRRVPHDLDAGRGRRA